MSLITQHWKKLWVLLIPAALATGLAIKPAPKTDIVNIAPSEELTAILNWEISKPATDEQWAGDTRKESLDIKFDYQLAEMLVSHQASLLEAEDSWSRISRFPDVLRSELLDMGIAESELEQQFAERVNHARWDLEKLKQSIERIQKEQELRAKGIDRTQGLLKIQPSTDREREELNKLQ